MANFVDRVKIYVKIKMLLNGQKYNIYKFNEVKNVLEKYFTSTEKRLYRSPLGG
ncbi:MAG: hypothetical protein K6E10_05755 [Eubacterium sp.]|nr:hypothetical protein [Eubacterium sp.]